MLPDTVTISLMAILQIFLMGSLGAVLVKVHWIDEDGLRMLTRLVVNIFLPLFIFVQLTGHFSYAEYPNWWVFPLLSLAITLVGFLVSQAMIRVFRIRASQNSFAALASFQNSGFIPMLIIAALFEEAVVQRLYVYIFLFGIGFNCVMWTFGVWLLNRENTVKVDWSKMFNAPMLATLITLGLIYLGWHRFIPAVVMKPAAMFGDCLLPMAIIVVGGNLAKSRLIDVDIKTIVVFVLTKLMILPAVALWVIWALKIDYLTGFLILIETVVPSAVTLSVIARYYKVEDRFVNQGIFFGHIGCIATIPIFLILFFKLIPP